MSIKNLEQMMKEDGWELKYYIHKNVKYFAFHKNGVQIDFGDVNEIDDLRDWKEIKQK